MAIVNLNQVKKIYKELDCVKLYFKILKSNDNSKQQVYMGSNFSVLNIFPELNVSRSSDNPKILKAPLTFYWVNESRQIIQAPGAQLIFYPQYPEVRFSGFLKGAHGAPSEIMNPREHGRVLFFGIKRSGGIIGLALERDNVLAKEIVASYDEESDELLSEIILDNVFDPKKLLLQNLKQIHSEGWLNAIRMSGEGKIVACSGTNCGGYTLEAKLGIKNNGISEPDFHGWEVKQFKTATLENPRGAAVTLFTPEPNSGLYKEKGVSYFLKKYGYPDKSGKENRINFSSPHKFSVQNPNTKLVLTMDGYDFKKKKIIDPSGGLVLLDEKDNVAARWEFANLMTHWNRKHNKAAYIPCISRIFKEKTQYQYGNKIFLGEGTEFSLFLNSCLSSFIYYDPGIKLELENGKEKIKRRSQFRIGFSNLGSLYHAWSPEDI